MHARGQVSRPFSSYKNLVYAPHTYSRSFTLDKNISFALALETAIPEATAMHAAVLVTEWGGSQTSNVRSIGAEQESHAVSGTHWVWKQNGGGGWGLFSAQDGANFTLRQERLHATSRIYPRSTHGQVLGYGQDNRSFWMRALCAKNGSGAEPQPLSEVFFPPHFAGCANSTAVNGSARLVRVTHAADGSATAFVSCDGDGEFQTTCVFVRTRRRT